MGGEPDPLGVTPRGSGVNVAVFSAHATAIEFCVFNGEREIRRERLRGRTGDVFHDYIGDVPVGARYGLRAHGPFSPREGHRFNPAKLLIDPYAKAIDRKLALHPSMFGYRLDTPDDGLSFDDTDSGPFVPKGIASGPEPIAVSAAPITPWPRTVLYEMHVRGFTARHPGVPETLRGTFAGLAHPAAIEHLVRLGITTVEIMPAAAWIEERHLAALGLRNYWGYNPIAFMAPDPGLAPGGWDEVRTAVAALTAAGIEVILDVVLNHSGEGDALGPTVSLRGLDNATYYRLPPDEPWHYSNETGCGNVLALDRPAPLRLAMDTLRAWAGLAGVHGFRFDLATTLGRREDGFDPNAPLLSAIAQDPVLRDLKLIAEPWDVGLNGYRMGAFPTGWGEWNDRFRDGVRRFWRGDSVGVGELATRLAGSSDVFASRGVASRSINFLVAHDGFTLTDLVSYTHKVNVANGEGNRDGTDSNYSWNNGAEGPSVDPAIRAARARDQRALLATLILARGTPMLAMGSEFGKSQGGNNNAYAQDNETAWLEWEAADEGLLEWTRHLLKIRSAHPVLCGDRFLTGAPFDLGLLPDVEWRDAAGQIMSEAAWNAPDATTLVMTLAGASETDDATDRVAVILHRGQNEVSVKVPTARAGYRWHLTADSAGTDVPADRLGSDPIVTVSTRSVVVLAEYPEKPPHQLAVDPALVDRLAEAAGIAPEWWDVSGRRTIVSRDTRLSLLSAMRLPATTEAEARDTLRLLSEDRDRRALPHSLVSRIDEPAVLRLASEPGLAARALWLTIEREDGSTEKLRVGAEDGAWESFTGADGLPARVRRIGLPPSPIGRHRVWRDDAPEAICHVTIAPRHCYLPDAFLGGGKRFGISAQLYALRRENDQGIGDFTTLAMLAKAARREGASVVGVNPLHMLFPGDRERASPYHPSDRRFLDPIYLDVADGGGDPNEALAGDFTRAAGSADLTGDLVAYSAVWETKRAILERRFAALMDWEANNPSASTAFRCFVADGGVHLRRFATFQAIAETRPRESWRQWPDDLRLADSAAVETFAAEHASRVRFHQYLQYLADRQLAAAARHAGLELGLYRDLAVGAAPDGAEAWSTAEDLAQGAWVGAPPDPFAAEGQNWHLPPLLPQRLSRGGFASFSGLIAANMRHAGALRIDHAMGLSRLFWIPDGGKGADGAYVSYPFADLLGQVALESTRARCLIVGEDLGTVPDGFRAILDREGILSYRVLLLERDDTRFRRAASYPVRAVACVTTHDLPPLAGWWEGADIRERTALGLHRDDSDADTERAADRAAMVELLREDGCLDPPDGNEPSLATIMTGAHEFVAAAPSQLALLQIEDLAGMREGVNLPGTDAERPNWRRKVPIPVETLLTGNAAQPILDAMRLAGRATVAVDDDLPDVNAA